MSTFSPVGSRSSDGMRVCVCVCVDGMNLKYALPWHIHISVHSIHASAVHKHMHTRILKPFEDSEPTGLIVDIPLHSVFAAFLYGADCVLLQWLLHLFFLFRKPSGDVHLLWSDIISGSLGQRRGEIARSAHRKHRH